jgi:hypothetical protein
VAQPGRVGELDQHRRIGAEAVNQLGHRGAGGTGEPLRAEQHQAGQRTGDQVPQHPVPPHPQDLQRADPGDQAGHQRLTQHEPGVRGLPTAKHLDQVGLHHPEDHTDEEHPRGAPQSGHQNLDRQQGQGTADDARRADRDGEHHNGRPGAVREPDAGRGGQTDEGTHGEAGQQPPARAPPATDRHCADGGTGDQHRGDHAGQGRGRGRERPGEVPPTAGDRDMGRIHRGREPDQPEKQRGDGARGDGFGLGHSGVLGHASSLADAAIDRGKYVRHVGFG